MDKETVKYPESSYQPVIGKAANIRTQNAEEFVQRNKDQKEQEGAYRTKYTPQNYNGMSAIENKNYNNTAATTLNASSSSMSSINTSLNSRNATPPSFRTSVQSTTEKDHTSRPSSPIDGGLLSAALKAAGSVGNILYDAVNWVVAPDDATSSISSSIQNSPHPDRLREKGIKNGGMSRPESKESISNNEEQQNSINSSSRVSKSANELDNMATPIESTTTETFITHSSAAINLENNNSSYHYPTSSSTKQSKTTQATGKLKKAFSKNVAQQSIQTPVSFDKFSTPMSTPSSTMQSISQLNTPSKDNKSFSSRSFGGRLDQDESLEPLNLVDRNTDKESLKVAVLNQDIAEQVNNKFFQC